MAHNRNYVKAVELVPLKRGNVGISFQRRENRFESASRIKMDAVGQNY